jgi:hypothetical protein
MRQRVFAVCALLSGAIACRDGLVRAPLPDRSKPESSCANLLVAERVFAPRIECPLGTSWDGEACMGRAAARVSAGESGPDLVRESVAPVKSALDASAPFAGTWTCTETAEVTLTEPPSPYPFRLAGTTLASIEETEDGFASVTVSAGKNSCSWRGRVSGAVWTAIPGQSCSRLDGSTTFLADSTAIVTGPTSRWRGSGKYSRKGIGGQVIEGDVMDGAFCTKL